ncbi:MAG: ATP-binding cassette domain-containing protein [Pseudomonadota bacterium]
MGDLSFDLRLSHPGFAFEMAADIPARGITAIMGPSGSGKTTLLRALAGLEPDVSGTARLGGQEWLAGTENLVPRDRRIGFVFQEGRLFEHLSVAQNIAYGAARRKVPGPAVQGIIDALGVRDLLGRRPVTLSGGEARRVSLARAMASGPDILFMDEPLSGLDDVAKEQVLPYIARAVVGSGVPVLYVTHAQAEVTQLADRVLLVGGGGIIGWGPVPPRLAVSVVGPAGPGRLQVALGPTQFSVPGQGAVGDARQITLPPGGVLVSRQHPGESAALAVVRAQTGAAHATDAPDALRLVVNGQHLVLPMDAGSPLSQRRPDAGEELWLTILRATLR